MNNGHIIAWMDDLQLGSHLAKLSTTHSYKLEFRDTVDGISEVLGAEVLIIDLNSISEKDLKKLKELKQDRSFTCLGFCQEINGPLINYFTEMGCDMVLKRYELIKNLGSILHKIFNGD